VHRSDADDGNVGDSGGGPAPGDGDGPIHGIRQ
jgi:hypothetical protein